MKLLAIETATEYCSAALEIGGDLRYREALAPRRHAELILPWVTELLTDGGITVQDLDALVFSRGPGSFTSLRIGISVAQGLAWGADIPVVPVSSLQAAAQASVDRGVISAIVALDARMDEVYAGRYRLGDGLMHAVGEETVCVPEQLCGFETSGWSGVGNGFIRYPQLSDFAANLDAVFTDAWPTASAMMPLAKHWLKFNAPLPADQAQPVYLRDQVARKPA